MADTAQLLAQLRDIHLPEATPEPAWWPLFMALSIIVASLAVLLYRHRKHHASLADQAQQIIKQAQSLAPEQAIPLLAKLLKRTVITLDTDTDVLTLHGNQWLQHLDSFFNTDFFTQREGQIFGAELYRRHQLPEQDLDAIAQQLRKLIRKRSTRWW